MQADQADSIRQAIDQAIRVAGTQKNLVEKLKQVPDLVEKKYSQQQVSYWLKVGRVPAEHAIALERATGIPRVRFCPKVFGTA